MKKIVKYGWVGKTQKPKVVFDGMWWDGIAVYGVFKKGERDYWEKEDWPPIKVRITVEEVE